MEVGNMNTREFLAKAQEAEALADATSSLPERSRWEDIAAEYRRLARAMAEIRGEQEPGDIGA